MINYDNKQQRDKILINEPQGSRLRPFFESVRHVVAFVQVHDDHLAVLVAPPALGALRTERDARVHSRGAAWDSHSLKSRTRNLMNQSI